jgi:hypothetical protein
MACSVLGLLHDRRGAQRLDGGGNLIRLMTHDSDGPLGPQRGDGVQGVLD